MGQFGNKRFRTIVQEMSNWEEAHRIKTNASKSALMFLSHKTKPKSKYLTLHPRNKRGVPDIISYKTSHKILGIMFDRQTNFVKHIKQINNTINQNVRSLRLLKRTSFKTKVLRKWRGSVVENSIKGLNRNCLSYTVCLRSIHNYQLQFARAPRPTFYYSEDHFTENMD